MFTGYCFKYIEEIIALLTELLDFFLERTSVYFTASSIYQIQMV